MHKSIGVNDETISQYNEFSGTIYGRQYNK